MRHRRSTPATMRPQHPQAPERLGVTDIPAPQLSPAETFVRVVASSLDGGISSWLTAGGAGAHLRNEKLCVLVSCQSAGQRGAPVTDRARTYTPRNR